MAPESTTTETPTVYLEDIEPSSSTLGNTDKETTKPTEKVVAASNNSSTASGGKRQRTLFDMMSGSQEKKSTEPEAKKLKFTPSSGKSLTVGKESSFTKLNAIPFSLSSFQESLTEEQKTLLKLECECMGKSWLKVLKDEIKKPYFISLKKFLQSEGVKGLNDTPASIKIYPSPKNIYTWSNIPLGKIKVVILGQDPYHGAGQAHGLCFSVPVGIPVPPSLRNIYVELKAEYPSFEPPKHGNLQAWADNGVLLLNTCLTVRAGTPGSHFNKGWEQFTEKIIDVVDRYGGANLSGGSEGSGIGRGVVFLAWGSPAAKRTAKLNKTKHLILTSAHPSPLSAHRGFLGNGHFKAANKWLEQRYGPEGKVDWFTL